MTDNEHTPSRKIRDKERLKQIVARKKEQAPPPRSFDPQKAAEQAEVFTNRLKKWRAHLWKWAKRCEVSCFRIYDRDIPELPFVVDEYARHLHISQVVHFRFASEADEDAWTQVMVEAASKALAVDPGRIFVKTREVQKGRSQYEKFGTQNHILQVQENGLDFEVNLSDYLDTGLFLDHRDTRALVGSMSLNVRMLNLFSYTGSFSAYAARGGARSTTSIDMSNTYSQWAQRNLKLNGFGGRFHQCIATDVLQWLPQAVQERQQYDLIVLDPPTFSNSNKMTGVFDVQKDHGFLINNCLRLLSRDGILLFSNNFRKFRLDTQTIRSRYIEDISNRTIPEDFKGKKPHRCWIIKRDS